MEDIIFGIPANEWSEIIRNYILAISALVTAYVAWKGMTAWREQLDLREDRLLAKSIATKLFHLKNIYSDVRNWGSSDQAFLRKTAHNKSKDELSANVDREYLNFNEKFGAADDVRAELYPLFLEADLLWGGDLKVLVDDYFKELDSIENKIHRRKLKLRMPYRNEKSWQKQWDKIEAIEEELFNQGDDDFLGTRLTEKFEKLSEHLKFKLGTKS